MSLPTEQTLFDACDEFFSIAELLVLFLDQCSANVLLNCTLVCRSWNRIILKSRLLQEHLFLKPARATKDAERTLNPVLFSHFAPILCPRTPTGDVPGEEAAFDPELGLMCATADLTSLPWARDTSMHAPSRRAFVREEASWRGMLISQPPIKRIDWWHEWTYNPSTTQGVEPTSTRGALDQEETSSDGWGHQDQSREYVTLGMLWDLVESRLTRGCLTRVQYFLHGSAVQDDPFATTEERSWIAGGDRSRRPYTPRTPRVKITTQQVWARRPWREAGFDMQAQQWVSMHAERAAHYTGDGFNILRSDCGCDRSNGASRFSKSDGFFWEELDGEASGG